MQEHQDGEEALFDEALLLEILENQLADNHPKRVKETLLRLTMTGHSREEAMLLMATEPVPTAELAQAVRAPVRVVERTLAGLADFYDQTQRGFELRYVAGGWRYWTRPEYAELIGEWLIEGQHAKLSQAALETLAVIAYHQPVTREVVKGIRGVNSDGVIASLVDKGLVRELGRDPQRGQAIIYGTTNAFLEKFGLRSTRDLPDLEQFAPDEQSRQFIRERLSAKQIAVEPVDGEDIVALLQHISYTGDGEGGAA